MLKKGKFFEYCLPYTHSVMEAVKLVKTKFPELPLAPFFTVEALKNVLQDLAKTE